MNMAKSLSKLPTDELIENQIVIKKERILIVEGPGDKKFFESLFRQENIGNIQVIPMGGKDSLNNSFFQELKTTLITGVSRNIEKIIAVGIVRDADTDYEGAFKSIGTFIKKLNEEKDIDLIFTKPTKCSVFTKEKTPVGIFIMPDCKNTGMLETLCCRSIEKDIKECIDGYINCVETKTGELLSNKDKRTFLCYQSIKTINYKQTGIGESIEDKVFDLQHECFNEIKKFVKELSEIQ
jgi:hypothetical protein